MAGQSLTLGRIFDIRVRVHATWLVLYAFVTYVLARGIGPLPAAEAYGFAALCALVLFASVLAHEFAHALTARRFGVRTEAVTLFLFGGVATLEEEPATPLADAAVALAGPVMSGVLAASMFAAVVAVDRFVPGRAGAALGLLGTYLAAANAVLALFNLIPAYPMDGGRVLRALLWRWTRNRLGATNVSARLGVAFALLFVASGVFGALARHDATFGWYAVLGAFLLRQSWSRERETRRPAGIAVPEMAIQT